MMELTQRRGSSSNFQRFQIDMKMLNEICENIKTAIVHGRTDIIRSILDTCDSNASNGEVTKDRLLNSKIIPEGTFLLLATQLNQADVVRNLLSSGADPNICNAFQSVTNEAIKQIYVDELLRATASSDVNRVKQILDAGVDVNCVDTKETKNSPLHWAACYGTGNVIKFLIDRGARVNAVNSCGATPLHDAISRGAKDVCSELINNGADVNIEPHKGNFAGKSALKLAQTKPDILELINLKLKKNEEEEDGESLKREEITKLLNNSDGSDQIDVKNIDLQIFKSGKNHVMYNSSYDFENIIMESSSSLSPPPQQQQNDNNNRKRHVSESCLDGKMRMGKNFSVSRSSSLEMLPKIEEAREVIEILSGTHLKSSSSSTSCQQELFTDSCLNLLWPRPQKITKFSEPGFVPQKQLHISVLQGTESIHKILDVWEISVPALLTLGYSVKIGDVQPSFGKFSSSPIECTVNGNLFSRSDTYQIHINSSKVHITANSLRGLHYSILTFTQMLKLSENSVLPSVLIHDYGCLRHRGVLLDISPRGRIPNLEFLFSIIETLSSLKINYLHLYTRLLPSNEWQLCYSKREMVAIDRKAQDRFINLVPVLDVDDNFTGEGLESMWQSFQEILTCFPNLTYVHIGPRLTALLIQTKEITEELDDTTSSCSNSINNQSIHNESYCLGSNLGFHRLWPTSATLIVCANSLRGIKNFVPRNVILMEYGFQADYDFKTWSKAFQNQGGIMGFCPGTASWNSLSGCPEAAVCNIYSAVTAAVEENAVGIVVAHWSGSYHLTPHPFSSTGFLVGAGLSWNPKTPLDYFNSMLGELLDSHILLDSSGILGKIILELGHIETYVLRCSRNQSLLNVSQLPDQEGTALYKLLTDSDNVNLEHFSLDIFAKISKYLKKCQKELFKVKLSCNFGEMIIQEILLSVDLMLTACRIGRALLTVGVNPNSNMGLTVINLGIENLPLTFRTDIANKLLAHIEQYKGTWLQRHLPAGLQTSLLILTSALHRFFPSDNHSDDYS
uniref:Beta-hexosaminidase bacterial type N-terminal domain-containing protein n=1 Tax=Pediculus humanus subsp. corporis TaxID=121224 RepID=A0A1S4N319_PEDHC